MGDWYQVERDRLESEARYWESESLAGSGMQIMSVVWGRFVSAEKGLLSYTVLVGLAASWYEHTRF
jgi:hypothetical protein